MKRHVILEKAIGETPLAAIERYRDRHPELTSVPLAYAGRLDPMASGKLLVLIGDECKKQKQYHGLDKQYEFSVIFGVSSDTGDVLGRITAEERAPQVNFVDLRRTARSLIGPITLPYPHFSSKTVRGKPLHVWTLEGRLNEIQIPMYSAIIHDLSLDHVEQKRGRDVAAESLDKIELIPPVTDESKVLGRDFRREDVRRDWQQFIKNHHDEQYTITHFICTCSSGLYMRSLAEMIAKKLGTSGLAYSIHRTKIGHYHPLFGIPFWQMP